MWFIVSLYFKPYGTRTVPSASGPWRALAQCHHPLADVRNELHDKYPSLKTRTEPDQWRSKFVTGSSYETIAL